MKGFISLLLLMQSALLLSAQDSTISVLPTSDSSMVSAEPVMDTITYLVKGKIVDDIGMAVPYASLSLNRPSDSTIVRQGLSDTAGNFSFRALPGKYFLEVSFTSFESRTITGIVVKNADTTLGNIVIMPSSTSMKAVVVVGEKSEMRLELDKRIFTVGKDLSTAGGNAADVLNNVPSISVDVDGTVNLRGSAGVTILIDGKPSALTSTADALRQIPANIIEGVEIITNPSSRYEASGEAGIINIILKKNSRRGFNGVVTLNAGAPAAFGGSFQLNYRKNKVNWFTSYGIDYRSSPGQGSSFQQYDDADTSFTYDRTTDITRSGISHNIMGGFDYNPNDKTTFTASVLYNPSNGINKSTLYYRDFNKMDELTQTVQRTEREDDSDTEVEGALSFRRKFNKKDHLLTADFKYISEDEVELSDYTQQVHGANSLSRQRAENLSSEYSWLFQSDYIHPINDQTKFEAGIRTRSRKIRNDYLLEQNSGTNGDWIVLPAFDNNMIYIEKVHAAYLQGSSKFKKLSVQGGLRLEYTDLNTELLKTSVKNQRDYLNLFPSATISYELNDDNSLQTSYSYRINRPNYRELLPFSNFSDLRSFFIGNPNLNPEFTHSIEAGWLKEFGNTGSLLSSIYYRHRKDVIQRITTLDSNAIAYVFPVNLSTQNNYGFEFHAQFDITDWWKFSTNVNLYRSITNGEYEGESFDAETFTGMNRTTTKVKFMKKWEFQGSFFYRAPMKIPQGKMLSMYALDAGVGGDIFKGKATLTFNVRDIFNTRKRRSIITREGYYSRSDFQWRSRQFMVTLSYRINQQKQERERDGENNGEGGGGEEDF